MKYDLHVFGHNHFGNVYSLNIDNVQFCLNWELQGQSGIDHRKITKYFR